MKMRFFLGLFQRTAKARQIPQLTEYLVTNPMFRNIVIGFHNTKANAVRDLDNYLEEELINKNNRKKPAGHIESTNRASKGPNKQ